MLFLQSQNERLIINRINMKIKELQLKRALRSVLLFLLLSVAGMTNALADYWMGEVQIGDLIYHLDDETLTASVIRHVDGISATGSLVILSEVTYSHWETTYGDQVYITHTYLVNRIGGFKNCSGLTGSLIIPNSVTIIDAEAFYNCSGLTGELTIPNSVTSIGYYAFCGCGNLTGSLTIPNSVTTIGYNAFYGCSGFTGDLTIGNSVTTIDRNAFHDCSGFTGSLTIGNSVTTIGQEAFHSCSGLTGNLTIPNSVTTIGDGAFYNCSGFTGNLTISNSVTRIGNYVFEGCSNLIGDLNIPDSVTSIGNYAFNGCSGFTGSLTIPNSVTSIGIYAFYGCNGFTGNLTIGDSVTTIGRYAFGNCSNFTIVNFNSTHCTHMGESGRPVFGFGPIQATLNIGENVQIIPGYAFSGCYGFTGSLTIPNSVTSIGGWAFSSCSGFTGSLIIPNSVNTIGSYAFRGCGGLSEVMMLRLVPASLGDYGFLDTNFLIYVPYESLNAYQTATNWSNYQNRIYPMSYTTIPGFGEDNDRWRFVASPLVANTAPTMVDNMILETAYDLYSFNQDTDAEWQNYKANTDDFVLENGQGYLFANAEDVSIIFKGEFNEEETKVVNLDYDAGKANAGWNLVGNPFPADAYLNRDYYVMNEEGTGINPVAVSASTPIPPCTGVFVKAEGEGETVVFTRAVP